MSKVKIIACLLLGVTSLGFYGNMTWEKQHNSIDESGIRKIIIHPLEQNTIFALAANRLFISKDKGQSFAVIFQLPSDQHINDLFIHTGMMLAATDIGLYESRDNGRQWTRTFHSSDELERVCLSVMADEHSIYLGTKKGLRVNLKGSSGWQEIDGALKDKPVYQVLDLNNTVYLTGDTAVYRYDDPNSSASVAVDLGNTREEEFPAEEDIVEGQPLIRDAQTVGESALLIVSTRGIFIYHEQTKALEQIYARTMPLGAATSVLILSLATEDCHGKFEQCLDLVLGTKRGVYFYTQGRWTPLYKGMETNAVNGLASGTDGTLYAATDKGVFLLPADALPFFNSERKKSAKIEDFGETSSNFAKFDGKEEGRGEETSPNFSKFGGMGEGSGQISYTTLAKEFENEPTVRRVHDLAVEYADVHPDKIKEWKELARKKAWLPSLDLGVDGGRDRSISDSIFGSSSSGGSHYVGPDDKSYGEDLGWDVSLSWDLADLIWSTDQTTIDSRSKLTVELREDVLDQVTRLYFERRRIQFELLAPTELEPQLRMEKEMRIEELTALLDALTGGEFSRAIENNSN